MPIIIQDAKNIALVKQSSKITCYEIIHGKCHAKTLAIFKTTNNNRAQNTFGMTCILIFRLVSI